MAEDADAKDLAIQDLHETLRQWVAVVDGSYLCLSHGGVRCGHRVFSDDLVNLANHARHVLRGEPCPMKVEVSTYADRS